jgi:multiple sugar transport system substrate-binding protein
MIRAGGRPAALLPRLPRGARRQLLALSLLLCCGGMAHADVQVVQMWTLLSGGDGARMRALIDGFNASQGGVGVESTTL